MQTNCLGATAVHRVARLQRTVRHNGMCEQFKVLLCYLGPVPCAFPFGHDRVPCVYNTFESGHCSLVAFGKSLAVQQPEVPEFLTDTAVIETAVELETVSVSGQ
jgi:hypothetical protein